MIQTVTCRKANTDDIDAIAALIAFYADQGIMLPRTHAMLANTIDAFVVAEIDGVVVGCGSLCQLGKELVEIRSLGIHAGYKGAGIGRKLVEWLIEEVKRMDIPKVMALTYEVAFFEKMGFEVVPKHIFPEKVWTDCIHCKKQHCCDEIAVLKRLS